MTSRVICVRVFIIHKVKITVKEGVPLTVIVKLFLWYENQFLSLSYKCSRSEIIPGNLWCPIDLIHNGQGVHCHQALSEDLGSPHLGH